MDKPLAAKIKLNIDYKVEEALKAYIDFRIEQLHREMEVAQFEEDIRKCQGALQELRRIGKIREYANEVILKEG